jgi:hypothetical protein
MPPYNGVKTHPPSKHALDILRALANAPILSYQINPGVRDRLGRGDASVGEAWAEPVELETSKGRKWHYQITAAGRAYLERMRNGDVS